MPPMLWLQTGTRNALSKQPMQLDVRDRLESEKDDESTKSVNCNNVSRKWHLKLKY